MTMVEAGACRTNPARLGKRDAGASRASLVGALLVCGAAVLGGAPAAMAQGAGAYGFAAPPSADANRVYGVNKQNGEVSVCQFERPEGSFTGITRCFERGEGAGPQKSGSYDLVATRYAGETGIFRVDHETGQMSICYVRETPQADGKTDSVVLCTAPAK